MKINNTAQLKNAIRQLEQDEQFCKKAVTDQFHTTVERLKPINIIKDLLGFKIKPSSTNSNHADAAAGFGVGLLSKLLLKNSTGFFKKLLLTATEIGAAKVVSKNSSSLKLWALTLLLNVFKPKKS